MGATTTGSDKGRDALGEDAPGATRVRAEKATDPEMEGDRMTPHRQIDDAALIVAVDTPGTTMAEGTSSGTTYCRRDEREMPVMYREIVNVQTGEVRKEGSGAHER